MKTKKETIRECIFFSVLILLSISLSTPVLSQTLESPDKVTEIDFAGLLFRAQLFHTSHRTKAEHIKAAIMKFRKTLISTGPRYLKADTDLKKARLLEELGYSPAAGYRKDKLLTMGVFAEVMVQVLDLDTQLLAMSTADDYVNILVREGILEQEAADSHLTNKDIITAFAKVGLVIEYYRYLSQREFALLLFETKKLDARFTGTSDQQPASVDDFRTTFSGLETRYAKADTDIEKIKFLEKLDYAPDEGYTLEKILDYGDFSVTMVKVFRLKSMLPENPTLRDYIRVLADEAIIESREPEILVPLLVVLDAIKKGRLSEDDTELPDYQRPLSPIE
ncbi:hypothetical protein ACFL27_18685 [candidate division CSSED10-310 bacterium]|uniref:Uncharacterized protein n=1 Tax=candidate division CSSED10-310 bacterium TaxID=2855610 RepID=A0ABV6Z1B8_UNCC1